jgi:anti-sigma regulatory factor (Ser/Thr protein kinase)
VDDPKIPAGRHDHFDADAAALAHAAAALDAFCSAEELPRDAVWPLQVALDEIVANIVSHAAAGRGGGEFDVWFRRDGDRIEIVVADDGPPFDPLALPGPDVTLPLEGREPGGLGIMLIKALMDDVRYERTARNVLTIRKRINTGGAPGGTEPDEHSAERA